MDNILHYEWCEDEQQWVPAEKIDCEQSIQDEDEDEEEDEEDLPTTTEVKRLWEESEKQALNSRLEEIRKRWGDKE